MPPPHEMSTRNLQTEEYVPKRACIHSTTRWFQGGMFVAFLITLIISLTARYENLSAGILWGAGLSFFSVIFVIISYISEPAYQQHPNPLIFWRTIADAIFIIRLLAEQFSRCANFDCDPLCNDLSFQCGCSTYDGASELCITFAGLLQFSLLAAECWFVCMSANLYFSLTNPFTDFKKNMKLFHLFCWGTGIVGAIIITSVKDLAGYSYLGFCWTNALQSESRVDPDTCPPNASINDILNVADSVFEANASSWLLFYLWMAVFLLYSIVIWIWAWKRLSEGMPETYAIRVQSINRARFYVIAVTSYWITVMIVYIAYLSNDAAKERDTLYEFMNFLLAIRGYVDLVVWFALNDFRVPRWKSFCSKNIEELDVDISPQVNAALRREVLFYTTSGIIQAVQAAERLPRTQRVQHLALLPRVNSNGVENPTSNDAAFDESMRVSKKAQRTKTFHDFEPHSFRRIRERFGVDNERYLNSLSTTAKERLSEGASGAFMFFSGDGALIVKSTSKEESKFLRSIASQYADYLCENPTSLLTRFYGCHSLELYGKKFSFIVMANLFDTDQIIHSRYDIKGSWVNRNADLPKAGKKVTCRHCNRKYIYQSTRYDDFNCEMRLGGHEPNVVLKDNDLTEKLRLDEETAMELYEQLSADTEMLYSFGIMDYSLLMGVHDVEYAVSGDDECDALFNTQFRDESDPKNRSADNKLNPFSADSVMEASVAVEKTEIVPIIESEKAKDSRSTSSSPERRGSSGSQRQLPRDGMRLANSVVGPAYYHLGLIDILQTWTLQKRAERFLKITFKRVDGDGLSAIPPKLYKERFLTKIADILGVQNIIGDDEGVSDHIFSQQNAHMDLEPEASKTSVHLLRSLDSSNHLISSIDTRPSSTRAQQTGQRTNELPLSDD